MDLTQRLATCKQCEKRKFDANTGIVCSLTLRKPDFVQDCKDFAMDPKAVAKKHAKTYAAAAESESGSSMSIWGVVAIIFVVVRIVLRFMRD